MNAGGCRSPVFTTSPASLRFARLFAVAVAPLLHVGAVTRLPAARFLSFFEDVEEVRVSDRLPARAAKQMP